MTHTLRLANSTYDFSCFVASLTHSYLRNPQLFSDITFEINVIQTNTDTHYTTYTHETITEYWHLNVFRIDYITIKNSRLLNPIDFGLDSTELIHYMDGRITIYRCGEAYRNTEPLNYIVSNAKHLLDDYWRTQMSNRCEFRLEVDRLTSILLGYCYRESLHQGHIISPLDFYYEKRPYGNKNIEMSIIHNMGWDSKYVLYHTDYVPNFIKGEAIQLHKAVLENLMREYGGKHE